jgi:hypothetical protein
MSLSVASALLLAAQAASAAAPAPAADRPVLDAFRGVCDKVGALDAMKAAALAAGWEEIPDSAEPRLGRLITLGKEATEANGTNSGFNFRRVVEGRKLLLIASRYEDKSGFWGNGCRLYDFDAAAPVNSAFARDWMGRVPTGVQALGPTIGDKMLWEPGWRSGMTVEISHVPQTSELKNKFGLSGNVLVAQAIGGF